MINRKTNSDELDHDSINDSINESIGDPINNLINDSMIAIIGMAGRFPGADSIDEFWRNLSTGVESVSWFSDRELIASGVESSWLEQPNFVPAKGILSDIERFDAEFFGISPKDAELLDPQQRLFLECVWQALEDAGYNPDTYKGLIGLYAGAENNTYLLKNIYPNLSAIDIQTHFPLFLHNERDYLSTRVSYKLNLKGPSLTVQTACSTSLVAIHLACQSLLSGECDLAIAGGISVTLPHKNGQLHQQGGVASPDGHCRAFDAEAQGSVFGNGVGVVVLKSLEEAIADRDSIYAIIAGTAVNNDGALRAGYTAPSVDGQAAVIAEAQSVAGVQPDEISYIEAHGSGTALGDPIEIAALTQVFRSRAQPGGCAIGSVKTNIGHLGAAAGVTGVIKTALALQHQQIPASLHFQQPNPKIDFARSPFYVNTALSDWPRHGQPRRAGVSSFGIGGTNAHAILQEAPVPALPQPSRPWQLLVLSARTDAALEAATDRLVAHLQQHPDLHLPDVAYTLQIGRRSFHHRQVVVCRDRQDAIQALQDPKRRLCGKALAQGRSVAFMFTGLGSHYVNMGRELYQHEPVFRQQVDQCCDLLQPLINADLREILYPESLAPEATASSPIDLRAMLGRPVTDPASERLNQTELTQPAVFVIEYALAQLWRSWGVNPVAMIGYSIGEYVAACLAGVLSLPEALRLVAKRAQLIQTLPRGAMLAVPLSEAEVRPLLHPQLSLSAINGPQLSVVAGTEAAIEQLAAQLQTQGLACRRLQTSHAFHSFMMAAIAPAFTDLLKTIQLQPPQIPYLSNVSGTWITAEQATDPQYWVQHLCQPVRFGEGIRVLAQQQPVLLEVGPGQTLCSLALQCLEPLSADQVVLSSLRYVYERQSDSAVLLNALGQLWLAGVALDWSAFYAHEQRQRVSLPTYPFERQRYWIEPPRAPQPDSTSRWRSLVTAAQTQAIAGAEPLDRQRYQQQRFWLDRLCTAYMNRALRQLGAFGDRSAVYSLDDLVEQCQIIPRYRELLARWLEVLVEHGHLQQSGAQFTQLSPISEDEICAILSQVKTYADSQLWIDIYQLYGDHMTAILTGKKEALEFHTSLLLKAAVDPSVQDTPSVIYYKGIMQAVLQEWIKSWPADAKLRILEIGAGTGKATEALLPLLPPDRTSYTFTDVGEFFLKAAVAKFSDYPFVEYRRLDIERSPQSQGYDAHSFDLVIAFNVLHIPGDLDAALAHVQELLAPGGMLLLWEITQARLEADIMDGLLMQPIHDPSGIRNMGNPFLTPAQWQNALTAHGFAEVTACSEFEPFREHIFLARTALASDSAADLPTAAPDPIARPITQLKSDIADWFYLPSWKRSALPPAVEPAAQCWLVFVDPQGLGDQLVNPLEQAGHTVITVAPGEQFSSPSHSTANYQRHSYRLNPDSPEDYERLLQSLKSANLTPTAIAHLWNISAHPESLDQDTLDHTKSLGFYSILFLIQAIAKHHPGIPLQLTVISNYLHSVIGEETFCPEKSLLLGAVNVIPQEYPGIRCQSIDVMLPAFEQESNQTLLKQLLAELIARSPEPVIAYRGRHRWVQTVEPIRLTEAQSLPLKPAGTYWITGGLGTLGMIFANYLAKTVQANLILTGRSALPDRARWSEWLATHSADDRTSRSIQQIRELEALGAKVLAVQAEASDLEQMRSVLTEAESRFGPVHGVIHAAGVPQELHPIAQLQKPNCERQLQAKVDGARVLRSLFQDQPLDFCLLMSSLASVLGGTGAVAYSAANQFLGAFAEQQRQTTPRPWISVDWDTWKTWDDASAFAATSFAEFAFPPTAGLEALIRLLAWNSSGRVLVSTGDLQPRLQQSAQFRGPIALPNSRHPRPNLANLYVAPTTELEQRIARILETLLGFAQIGIHDNFFALGGDSLTGTVLIAQLRQEFQIELPVRAIFESPTIAELALLIEASLIAELESLTEDEAKQRIEEIVS